MPPPERPTDLSLWVGAYVNPLPALGVALEIRPLLLRATTARQLCGNHSARRRGEVLISLHRRAQDLLRAEFYAWCCSSCARKYVKPRPDPKELVFATDDDEPLNPMKRTRLSF